MAEMTPPQDPEFFGILSFPSQALPWQKQEEGWPCPRP